MILEPCRQTYAQFRDCASRLPCSFAGSKLQLRLEAEVQALLAAMVRAPLPEQLIRPLLVTHDRSQRHGISCDSTRKRLQCYMFSGTAPLYHQRTPCRTPPPPPPRRSAFACLAARASGLSMQRCAVNVVQDVESKLTKSLDDLIKTSSGGKGREGGRFSKRGGSTSSGRGVPLLNSPNIPYTSPSMCLAATNTHRYYQLQCRKLESPLDPALAVPCHLLALTLPVP